MSLKHKHCTGLSEGLVWSLAGKGVGARGMAVQGGMEATQLYCTPLCKDNGAVEMAPMGVVSWNLP